MRVRGGRGRIVRPLLLFLLLLTSACASAPRPAFFDERPRSTASDTGACKPLFILWDDDVPKRSCWHRLWEVPAALVVVPTALGVITAPVWVPILLL